MSTLLNRLPITVDKNTKQHVFLVHPHTPSPNKTIFQGGGGGGLKSSLYFQHVNVTGLVPRRSSFASETSEQEVFPGILT